MARSRVFFDFGQQDKPLGRVIFELYSDLAPKTAENFRALATGERSTADRRLYYKGSTLHRVIKDFMAQGGDFTKNNGTGGESIYGGAFEDENLGTPLDAEGLLAMANKGPNTNKSQWFVTLRPCPHLNGKHSVFGRVLKGYEIFQEMAEMAVDEKDRPSIPLVIINCGELELRKLPKKAQEVRFRSPTPIEDGSKRRITSEDAAPRKKPRKEKKRDKSPSPDEKFPLEPRKETEAEYDARLEREEQERIRDARKRELETIKQRNQEIQTPNGIRYKGRGTMKYRDPETSRD